MLQCYSLYLPLYANSMDGWFLINSFANFNNTSNLLLVLFLLLLICVGIANRLRIIGIVWFLIFDWMSMFNFFILFSMFFINSIALFLILRTGSTKFCPSWRRHWTSNGMSIEDRLTNQFFLMEVREELLKSIENVYRFIWISSVYWFGWSGGLKNNDGKSMFFCILLAETLVVGYEQ